MRSTASVSIVTLVALSGACASTPPPVSGPPPAAAPSVGGAPPATAATSPAPPSDSGSASAGTDVLAVTVVNPLAESRARETVELPLADLTKTVAGLAPEKVFVVDATGTPVLSQWVDTDGDRAPDQLVFQVDLAANEGKTLKLRVGDRPLAVAADYQVYGRFVRERFDDFAWENDWIVNRVYGPALETAKNEALTSSGIDVWVKRVRRLVVNEWYMTDNYHQDHGDGLDAYKVGPSRGCGGVGIWTNGKLAVSKNFTTSRVLANGPIRLVFELDYAPWQAGPIRVGETKHVILDAGSLFNHFVSTFSGKAAFSLAVGAAKHPGESFEFSADAASMRTWEPLNEGKDGNVGCAVVLPPGTVVTEQQTDAEHLAVAAAKGGTPADYYVGNAWDRGGRVADAAAWAHEVQSFSRRLGAPAKVTLSALPAQ